ncbi:single-stranded DNA-binding protein [Microbacterium protaetiae]|nr:single-stranded DNA-binding protein [Microbacterium protaetiae]
MNDTITIMGNLAADPVQRFIGSGTTVTSFRVASSRRYLDKKTGNWVDGEPNWYQVSAFRALGEHAFTSLRKGERVIVTGRLSVRHWENEKGKGVSVEIEAEAVGHDLRWGTTKYTRVERGDQWQVPAGAAAGGEGPGLEGQSTGEWVTAVPGAPADGAPVEGGPEAGRDWGGAPVAAQPAPAQPAELGERVADRDLADAPF